MHVLRFDVDMPAVIENTTSSAIRGGEWQARTRLSRPLEYTGSLDSYTQLDLTPVIGREYHGLQIADVLKSKDRDQIIKDLAVTGKPFNEYTPFNSFVFAIFWFFIKMLMLNLVSQRGVVFLRAQDVTPQQMRDFMEHLTELAGCVRLHGPPVTHLSFRWTSILTKAIA